jgi:hypothetical protein
LKKTQYHLKQVFTRVAKAGLKKKLQKHFYKEHLSNQQKESLYENETCNCKLQEDEISHPKTG